MKTRQNICLLLFAFMVVLKINAQSPIRVGDDGGNLKIEYPDDATRGISEIQFFSVVNGDFTQKIDGSQVISKNSFTNCNPSSQAVTGSNISFTLNCDMNLVELELEGNKEYLVFNAAGNSEIKFTPKEVSVFYIDQLEIIPGDNSGKINFYEDGNLNAFKIVDTRDISALTTDVPVDSVDLGNKKILFEYKHSEKLVTISSEDRSIKNKLKFENNKLVTTNTTETVTSKTISLFDFPLPKFVQGKDIENKFKRNTNKNRILIIDAFANKVGYVDRTGLYKHKKKINESEDSETNNIEHLLCPADALPNTGYLTVVINNYNFYDLESFIITVAGEDYDYEMDIKTLYDLVVTPKANNGSGEGEENIVSNSADIDKPTDDERENDPLLAYLYEAFIILESYNNNYININDLYEVVAFKDALKIYYDSNEKEFSEKAKLVKNAILRWHATSVGLTPISIDIPANDEVGISYSIKSKGISITNKALGTFRTRGKFSVDYGAGLFYSNLKNGELYQTSETITDADGNQSTELRNKIDNRGGSFGIGMNFDMSYRTGSELRPTLNFGFFIPLEETIVPYATAGLGVGIYGKNYKVNLHYGMAVGQVTYIKDQYTHMDMTGSTVDISDITYKKFLIGNYVGLSLSYNLFKK